MTKHPIPEAALEQHTAILGKTGSGKTTTSKLLVEQVVAAGARVCVLDTIKSDWWGITSSADGKRPGLPFQILGGPRGHVPLPSSAGKAVAEIVANGALPLSIVDMADFEPGGIQKFFVDFAPTLLRRMRGVSYLERELLPFCCAEGLGVISYSPMARGFLTGRGRRDGPAPTERVHSDDYALKIYGRGNDTVVAEAVERLAAERKIAPSQVALAWTLSRPE